MQLVVVTPPEPILTPADARTRLQLGGDSGDEYLSALIAAATGSIDGPAGWLGGAIGEQDLELRTWGFGHEIRLPCPPVVSITSVTYVDPAGETQTADPATYRFDGGRTIWPVSGATWPAVVCRDDAVRVRYVAGYPDAGDPAVSTVPEPIKQAILLQVRYLHSIAGKDLFLSAETSEGIGSQQWIVSGNAGTVLTGAAEMLLSPFRVFS